MSREIPFGNFKDITKNYNNRPIVLFGAGNIAEKTFKSLQNHSVEAIVDNASNLWGETQLDNIEIRDPQYLKFDNNPSYFVVICTTSFGAVSKQLASLGYKNEIDFIVSPILNDLRIISELESVQRTLMFSSGSPTQDSSEYGGGIYKLELDGDEWKHEKMISGNCYGIIKYKNNFVSVDTEIGIFEFDDTFSIIRQSTLPQGTRAHGVAFAEFNNSFYVVGSYQDAVIQIDADTLEVKDRISYSNKLERLKKASHHSNDCCILGSSLYVSMFSLSGNWKNDIFDGGVLEIDLTTKEIGQSVIKDLWMPHNISYIEGGLVVLDSLPGYLRKNNASVVGTFSAFTRGLAYDGLYYYVGQSRNRNFSKNLGVSKNISIDTAIVIFDEETKVSRSLQLSSKLSEIHSIVIIK